MSSVTQPKEGVSNNDLRNRLNLRIRLCRQDIEKVEMQLLVAVEMLQQNAVKMQNRLNASKGQGKSNIITDADEARNLSDRIRLLATTIETEVSRLNELINVKEDVRGMTIEVTIQ